MCPCVGRLDKVWETVLSLVPNSKISWLPSSAVCHHSIEVHNCITHIRQYLLFLCLFKNVCL